MSFDRGLTVTVCHLTAGLTVPGMSFDRGFDHDRGSFDRWSGARTVVHLTAGQVRGAMSRDRWSGAGTVVHLTAGQVPDGGRATAGQVPGRRSCDRWSGAGAAVVGPLVRCRAGGRVTAGLGQLV